jgi:hypothetical protein
LNIFKYNQKRWFHNLQFYVTIYKYKIRHKKYVGKHTFSETRKKFILLYNVYDLKLKIAKAFFQILAWKVILKWTIKGSIKEKINVCWL